MPSMLARAICPDGTSMTFGLTDVSTASSVAVALAGPVAHALFAAVGAVVAGDLGSAIVQINVLTALLLLLPLPPLPGGALVAALMPPLDERGSRWDQLRRTDTTPWLLVVLAVAVLWHTVTG